MPVSIKDIARATNVSYSTVSRALNNSPRVKPATRTEIQRVAAEMGYLPSAIARSLVTRRTNTIGVVVTTITDLFFAEVIRGIEEQAVSVGYSVILTNSEAQPDREMAAIQALRSRRVDGIILVAACADKERKERLLHSTENNLSIVIINNVHAEHIGYSIETDNLAGGQEATRHLIELGHQRIAHISGPPNEWDGVERQQGYKQALRRAGLPVDPALIIRGDNRPAGGMAAAQQLLAMPEPPTAIFCYNDATALGVMRAIHATGRRIPEDISVVGFDDIALASYFEPPLTTMAQPKRKMGARAVQMILDLIEGDVEVTDCVLPSRLIVRQSTAPPG